MTRRALRVYAALSELQPGNADVLNSLLPFFEPILAVMNGKIFDPKLFALGVQKIYKWRFNEDIAEQFIPRLVKAQYLEERAGGSAVSISYASLLMTAERMSVQFRTC